MPVVRCVWILAMFAISAFAADAAVARLTVATELTCPATAAVGETVMLGVHLESRECLAFNVRLMSAMVGNVDETAAAAGVFGPVVTGSIVSVPAATGCPFSIVPALVDISLSIPPPTPSFLVGTAATHFVISEWEGGMEVQTKECMIQLPEPTMGAQLLSGLIAVIALSRRRGVWN